MCLPSMRCRFESDYALCVVILMVKKTDCDSVYMVRIHATPHVPEDKQVESSPFQGEGVGSSPIRNTFIKGDVVE